jgi:hypothetical protein
MTRLVDIATLLAVFVIVALLVVAASVRQARLGWSVAA